jgi:hypothetical protein
MIMFIVMLMQMIQINLCYLMNIQKYLLAHLDPHMLS